MILQLVFLGDKAAVKTWLISFWMMGENTLYLYERPLFVGHPKGRPGGPGTRGNQDQGGLILPEWRALDPHSTSLNPPAPGHFCSLPTTLPMPHSWLPLLVGEHWACLGEHWGVMSGHRHRAFSSDCFFDVSRFSWVIFAFPGGMCCIGGSRSSDQKAVLNLSFIGGRRCLREPSAFESGGQGLSVALAT